ncbi:hypothetical protein PFISCL1PPCAC_5500, partial [Pristionchus fissidentatus]
RVDYFSDIMGGNSLMEYLKSLPAGSSTEDQLKEEEEKKGREEEARKEQEEQEKKMREQEKKLEDKMISIEMEDADIPKQIERALMEEREDEERQKAEVPQKPDQDLMDMWVEWDKENQGGLREVTLEERKVAEEKRREENEREARRREEKEKTTFSRQYERWKSNQKKYDTISDRHEEEMSKKRDEEAAVLRELDKEKRIMEVREENEKIEQACRRYYGGFKSEMTSFVKMMKQRSWNEEMEEKWTERLEALRESFTRTHESFTRLQSELELVQKDGKIELGEIRFEIEITVSLIIDRVRVIMRVMDNEMEDMRRLSAVNPEAKFFSGIKKWAKMVDGAASVLI